VKPDNLLAGSFGVVVVDSLVRGVWVNLIPPAFDAMALWGTWNVFNILDQNVNNAFGFVHS
jgi:hypothetical protein